MRGPLRASSRRIPPRASRPARPGIPPGPRRDVRSYRIILHEDLHVARHEIHVVPRLHGELPVTLTTQLGLDQVPPVAPEERQAHQRPDRMDMADSRLEGLLPFRVPVDVDVVGTDVTDGGRVGRARMLRRGELDPPGPETASP